MALLAKVVSFTVNSSTGNQAITGVGFRGKAVLFLFSRQTGNGTNAELAQAFGAAISSSAQWSTSQLSLNNQASSVATSTLVTNRCLQMDNNATTVAVSLSFVSFDADGFTVNVQTVVGSGFVVTALVLGGSDFIPIACGSFDTTSGTGSQSVTGLSARPSGILMSGSIPGTTEGRSNIAALAVGAAAAGNQYAVAGFSSHNVGTMNTSGVLRERILQRTTSGASNSQGLALTSFDAGGFTFTKSVSVEARNVYLAWRGRLRMALGTDTQRTSTGTKDTALPFTPKAVILGSASKVTSDSAAADNAVALGWSDGTSQGCIAGHDLNGSLASRSARAFSNAAALRIVRRNSDNSGSTTDALAACAFGQKKFTLDWTTADATARQFWYLAMGDAPPPDMRGGFQRNMRGGFVN